MAVGNAVPKMGYQSAVGIAEETTLGTFVTATAFIEFNSESLKQEREELKVPAVNTTRDYKKRMIMNETVSGSLEAPVNVAEDAFALIVKQAMGGTVSANTLAAGAVEHTFNTGDMESNAGTNTSSDVKGLSISVRRGDTNVWNHAGCRVNNLTLSGEIGSPVGFTCEIIGSGCSISSSIPTVSFSDVLPINFVDIAFETGDSITNVSAEYVTNFELSLNNNIDGDQRSLGSRNISVLPPVMRDVALTVGMRFDTTTAYDRFIDNTMTAIRITADTGVTITAGGTTYAMIIRIPAAYLNSNQPEVGGAETLTQELSYTGMYNTEAAYSIQMMIRNATANYF